MVAILLPCGWPCTYTHRYTRAEHEQSKQTIQQLLRELMLLRDAISRSGQGAAGGRSSNPAGECATCLSPVCSGQLRGPVPLAPLLCLVVNARRVGDNVVHVICRLPAGALDMSSGGGGSPKAGSKQMSKGQLLNELHAMRSRMAEEQSRRREAEVEKVTRVTAARVLRCAVLCWGHAPGAWLEHTHLHSAADAHVVAITTAVSCGPCADVCVCAAAAGAYCVKEHTMAAAVAGTRQSCV